MDAAREAHPERLATRQRSVSLEQDHDRGQFHGNLLNVSGGRRLF